MYSFGGLRREGGGESEMLPNLQRLSVVRPVACAPNSRQSLMTLGRCAITLLTATGLYVLLREPTRLLADEKYDDIRDVR
jgi:hypothetical protein